MIAFFPKLNKASSASEGSALLYYPADALEFIFLADASASMRGTGLASMKHVLLACLRALPDGKTKAENVRRKVSQDEYDKNLLFGDQSFAIQCQPSLSTTTLQSAPTRGY